MKNIFITTILILYSIVSYGQSPLYSFFVAGHTYGTPGVNNPGLHPPFKQKFSYIQSRTEIKFGILTGDIVITSTEQDWDEVDADIDTLGLPVYFAVGNHDMSDRELYENRYGSTYYYFKYENDLFIVLDPNIDHWNISGEQLEFLQNVLNDNAATSDNIYVFFHQVLWWDSNNQFYYIHCNSYDGRADSINFWTEVEPLFRNLPNEVFMFAGDVGATYQASDVTYDHYDNITLISSGMGEPNGENFVVVNVNADKSVSYDLICLSDEDINCLGDLTDYLVVDHLDTTFNPAIIKKKLISIFPNPVTDHLTVTTHTTQPFIHIQVYDLAGRLLINNLYHNRPVINLDVSNLYNGLYTIKVFNDSIYSVTKFIKR